MTEPMSAKQLAGVGELIKTALSKAGAFCGQCSFEPGDRNKCRDCERCLDWYAKAVLPLLDTSAERVPGLLAELGQKAAEVERLRVEHDRDLGSVIDERDRCEDWADRLASAVGPIELIGEHSSHNNPWENALDLITPHAEVQQLRAQVAEMKAERSGVRAAAFAEAAKELTELPLWFHADLHEDWETGVQEAAKRVQEMAEKAAKAGDRS